MTGRARRARAPAIALTIALGLSAGAGSALAQTTGDLEQRSLHAFLHGMQAVRSKHYQEGLALFRESHRLVPRPQTLWNIARAEERLGMNAAAHRDLVAYLHQFSGKISPLQRRKAADLRHELQAKLAHVTIVADAPGASVLIDGVRSEPVAWVDPGDHLVRVVAPDRDPVEKRVSIKTGERKVWDLTPPKRPDPPPAVPPPLRKVGLVLLGAGAAGLAAGAILGARALERGALMRSECSGRGCESEVDQTAYVRLQAEGLAYAFGSNLAFALGAALTGMGAYATLAPGRPRPTPAARGPAVLPARTIAPAAALVPVQGGAVGFIGGSW